MEKIKNTEFSTNALAGALKKNDEMNKNGEVEVDTIANLIKKFKRVFQTDAFEGALKINEERNKKGNARKVILPDNPLQSSEVKE